MAEKIEPTGRDRAFSAVVRHFPLAEFAIRKLMKRSEVFSDICEELADAEIGLANVPTAPPELCDARKTEWQDLVDRLVAEVAAALMENEPGRRPTP